MTEDRDLIAVERRTVRVPCPSFAPGEYLAWASWWHRVNASLLELALDENVGDVEVVEQVAFWDRLLQELALELPLALHGSDALAPVVSTTTHEASAAARVARSRLAWLRDAELVMLRADPDVLRVMHELIAALDGQAEPRPQVVDVRARAR